MLYHNPVSHTSLHEVTLLCIAVRVNSKQHPPSGATLSPWRDFASIISSRSCSLRYNLHCLPRLHCLAHRLPAFHPLGHTQPNGNPLLYQWLKPSTVLCRCLQMSISASATTIGTTFATGPSYTNPAWDTYSKPEIPIKPAKSTQAQLKLVGVTL